MHKLRVIARLDIKNEFVIKGIHLEGLRKIGNPIEFAKKYYLEGIDEIIFMDSVASLYGRNNIFHIIEAACKEVFVPITIGGGLRSISDVDKALKSGADKIAINSQAIKTPQLISDISKVYGSQCIVASIEAKKKGDSWEAYIDNGREETGKDAIEWAKELEALGAGEIFITSIDKEGTKKGFDIELVNAITNVVSIPVIVSGGAGKTEHIVSLCTNNKQVNAVAIASLFHYNLLSISNTKKELINNKVEVRI